MKSSLLIAALFVLAGTKAHAIAPNMALVKSCETVISFEGKTGQLVFEIYSNGKISSSRFFDKRSLTEVREDSASIYEETVRPGLESVKIEDDTALESLNKAETLVVHAMSVKELGMTAGLDLSSIRYAKVYVVGTPTSYGSSSIIEAKDANGKLLGTFLGGFFVAPCQ